MACDPEQKIPFKNNRDFHLKTFFVMLCLFHSAYQGREEKDLERKGSPKKTAYFKTLDLMLKVDGYLFQKIISLT